jgi:dihydrofolate reductase
LKKIIIVAIAKNNVIGKANGEMPWHVKEEFQHFKKTTLGFPVIMGRKTFETLGKPLKGRLNIVITRNENYKVAFEEVLILDSIDTAIKYCEEKRFEKIFIIGGGEIYLQSIDLVDEMIISRMKFEAEGEVKFPEIDESDWIVEKIMEKELFDVFIYRRKNAKQNKNIT